MKKRAAFRGGGARGLGGKSAPISKAAEALAYPQAMPSTPQLVRSFGRNKDAVLADIALAQQLYDARDWDGTKEVVLRLIHRHEFRVALTYDALACCCQNQGKLDEALKYYQMALDCDRTNVASRNRMIMITDAMAETTPEKAARVRQKWWAKHGADVYAKRQPHLNSRDPERPIRVGYVSGDFQFHSAASVFQRIALHHSPDIVPYFYSSTPHKKWDQITKQFFEMPGWRDVVGWPDALVAGKIRADEIDVLVDLTTFTDCSRLVTFAYKPAPIQLTGWGYATGTGFPCFDGLLSDRVVIPEDRQAEHVEPIVYLPSVIDYEPLEGLPEPGPLPCLTSRPTFGVFQRSLKLNAEDVEVWRQILERLPESRLIMKSHYCQSLQDWLKDCFRDQWPQVEVRGEPTAAVDHKGQHAELDLSLDTWPQTGGVSACDSLYMGVPLVTLIGPRVIQRTTASLLTNVGLPQFITETPEAYIQTAIDWVTTRKHELAAIRGTLRDTFLASPICAGYPEAVEAMYREQFRAWCAKPLSIEDAMYRLQAVS